MENGIYTNETAAFFVLDGKVIMRLKGSYYRTTTAFMIGVKKAQELSAEMAKDFNGLYEKIKSW